MTNRDYDTVYKERGIRNPLGTPSFRKYYPFSILLDPQVPCQYNHLADEFSWIDGSSGPSALHILDSEGGAFLRD